MPQHHKSDPLPNSIEAMWFLCRCFDLQRKELGLNGSQLQRAIRNEDISDEELRNVRNTLQKGIDQRIMAFGIGSLPDQLLTNSLSLYERIRPQLRSSGLSRKEVFLVLLEHLFIPTTCAVMFPHWRQALGTEYQGEKSWYVPALIEGKLQKPVQRVLDCWLRTAGFKTAYGVSKTIAHKSNGADVVAKKWDAWKRSIKDCLEGKHLPSLTKLHKLVDTFPEQVAWLDHTDSWKRRFTFAFAIQKACDEMETLCRNTASKVAPMIQAVGEEQIVSDDENILTKPSTFFATRLIQRRLKETKEWDEIVAKAPTSIPRHADRAVSREEMERIQQEDFRQMNIGNHLLKFIQNQEAYKKRQQLLRTPFEQFMGLNDFIVELGVEQLNRLLEEKRKASKRKRR